MVDDTFMSDVNNPDTSYFEIDPFVWEMPGFEFSSFSNVNYILEAGKLHGLVSSMVTRVRGRITSFQNVLDDVFASQAKYFVPSSMRRPGPARSLPPTTTACTGHFVDNDDGCYIRPRPTFVLMPRTIVKGELWFTPRIDGQ
eukprot:IDg3695t1